MPSNVDLFSMLRQNALEALSRDELEHELSRSVTMMTAVLDYQKAILKLLLALPKSSQ